jgi:hypothetical protein
VDDSGLKLSFISPTTLKFSQLKYMSKNKQISFEEENKINGLENNFALSDH